MQVVYNKQVIGVGSLGGATGWQPVSPGMRGRIVSFAAALAFAAATANAAVWTGGANGTLDDAANWDGNPATSTMVFTNDCTLTLSADATIYQPLTDGNATDVPTGPIRNNAYNHSITFDLNGHTLLATNNYFASNKFYDAQYWRCLGSSATFTGGGTLCVMSGSMTNAVKADNSGHHSLSLTFTGAGTRFVGSWANTIPSENYPGARFRLLDGAEAVGNYYYFAGFNMTNEVSGGAHLRYRANATSWQPGTTQGQQWIQGLCVGGQLNGTASASRGDVLKISGAGTVVEPIGDPTVAYGYFKIGNGGTAAANGGSRVIVEDGATLVVPRQTAIGHGSASSAGEFHSNSNELVVTGSGTTLRQKSGNQDFAFAVGRRGSFNRLLIDNGAFAKVNALSCGGEIKNQFGNNNNGYVSSYTSAWNRVTVDHGSTLDSGFLYIGFQHSDHKRNTALYGAQCFSNRVEILGGATLFNTNGTTLIGCCAPYSGNILSISGAGTKAKFDNPQGYGIELGLHGSASNRLEVLDGAQVEIHGTLDFATGYKAEWGYGPDGATIIGGRGNMALFEGEGTTVTGTASNRGINFGAQTNGNENVLWVGDGATLTWPGGMVIYGFDNKIVVSNGTFNLAGQIRSVWNNVNMNAAGRTRFVFAGAAPKLVSSSASQSKFMNEAVLRFEVPAAGWTARVWRSMSRYSPSRAAGRFRSSRPARS